MACEVYTIKSDGYEGAGFYLAARLSSPVPPDITLSPLTQSRVSSITWKSFNPDGSQIASGTYDKASAIQDTLLPWDEDETGYNFFATIAGSNCPLGDTAYRIEITVNHDSTMKTDIVIVRNTKSLWSR